MVEGYDGAELIDVLKEYLAQKATVLELGMGPGKDFDILKKWYAVTGSDNSQLFIDLVKKKNKNADVMLLDAITLDTDRQFDCIYSNKVLHHLTRDELKQSLLRQKKVVNNNGLLFHSFWYGDKEEFFHGLRFTYYTEPELTKMVEENFEIMTMKRHTEIEESDSFYVLLKKKHE